MSKHHSKVIMDYIPFEVDVPKSNIATFAIAIAICYKRKPTTCNMWSQPILFDKVKQKEEPWTLTPKLWQIKKSIYK